MNQRRDESYETYTASYARPSGRNYSRASSLDSSPKALPQQQQQQRRFRAKRDNIYQSMIEDTSLEDSDGSNIVTTSTTTTNTGE